MPVRRIDHDDIGARCDQRLGALEAGIAHGGGCGDAQAASRVFRSEGVQRSLVHVLDGEQADAPAAVVNDHETLDPVLVEQAAGFLDRRVDLHGDDFARHQACDFFVRIFSEARIAVGDDADDLAVLLDDWNAGKTRALFQLAQLAQRRSRSDGHGVHDHAALVFLHLRHFAGLLFNRQVAVDDADAACLGHGNGEARFGDRIHGRREQGDVQRNRFGQKRRNVDFCRHYLARAGLQQHVVEGDRLSDFHVGSSLFGLVRESRGLVKPLPQPVFRRSGGSPEEPF